MLRLFTAIFFLKMNFLDLYWGLAIIYNILWGGVGHGPFHLALHAHISTSWHAISTECIDAIGVRMQISGSLLSRWKASSARTDVAAELSCGLIVGTCAGKNGESTLLSFHGRVSARFHTILRQDGDRG